MNNFQFDRFKKVVSHDFQSTYNLYGMSMVIIMLMPLAIWLFALVTGIDSIPSEFRLGFINFLTLLTAAIAGFKIYGSCNLSGRGNYFALLPASLGEKFFSMMIYCFIVSPLAVFIGSCAIDTLLTLLPFGSFDEYIWNESSLKAMIREEAFGFNQIQNTVLMILKVFGVASLFMFTNTIFKKNKFIKTVLWLMLISFVFSLILMPIVGNLDWNGKWVEYWLEKFENADQTLLENIIFWSQTVINLLFTALFSFLTWRRLKKMQY